MAVLGPSGMGQYKCNKLEERERKKGRPGLEGGREEGRGDDDDDDIDDDGDDDESVDGNGRWERPESRAGWPRGKGRGRRGR